MKSMNISKRDVKVFLIGMLAMLAIITAYDWENNLAEFKRGFNAGYADARSN